MGVSTRPSGLSLCPLILCLSGLFHIPWTSTARTPHYPCLLRSCSFCSNTRLTCQRHLSAPLRLHLLLSLSLPSAKPQRTPAWLFAGSVDRRPLQHHNGQSTRPPGTLHDIHATLGAHTGQALPCGHLAIGFQSPQAVMVACVHTGTQTLAPASVSQDMSLALRAKAGCSAL